MKNNNKVLNKKPSDKKIETRKTLFLLSNSMDFKCRLKFRMKYPGYSSSYFFHVTSPDLAVEEET